MIFGAGLRCEAVSPTVCRWLRKRPGELTMWGWTSVIPDNDRDRVRRIGTLLQQGELPPPSINRYQRADGALVQIMVTYFWRLHADGTPDRVIARQERIRESTCRHDRRRRARRITDERSSPSNGDWIRSKSPSERTGSD
jgi:PAS domain-containing protein